MKTTLLKHLNKLNKNLLIEKYKTVYDDNDQYMLTINRSELDSVRSLILPYMHESMLHKLGLNSTEAKVLCFKL
jgi:hypothetical protein